LQRIGAGFEAGPPPTRLIVPGAPPAVVLICYEAIFPAAAVPDGQRPGWLINLTNDAWFGISSGPYQHFQQARMLAIAEGLPLVRAANDGISAVIDPVGRIVRSLPLGAEGVLDAPLPRAIEPTIYARFGNLVAILLMVTAGILLLRRRIAN
jgi:apolipoprotein N-acyltransferase